MFGRIQQLLKERGIFLSAPISLSDCTVTKTYLLERESIPKDGSAVIFAIPYHSEKTGFCIGGNCAQKSGKINRQGAILTNGTLSGG